MECIVFFKIFAYNSPIIFENNDKKTTANLLVSGGFSFG